MLVPVVVVLGVGYGIKKIWNKPRGMTPQRTKVYQEALRSLDSANLRDLAAGFRQEGLNAQAIQLEKRARLRDLPDSAKEKRRQVQRDLLKLTGKDASGNVTPEQLQKDIARIEEFATLYEQDGAVGSAEKLREYAQALKNAAS